MLITLVKLKELSLYMKTNLRLMKYTKSLSNHGSDYKILLKLNVTVAHVYLKYSY